MKYTFSDRVSSLKGSAIREIFKYAADPQVISLAGGNPAPELFPHKELSEIAREMLAEQPVLSLQYGVTEGYGVLREQVPFVRCRSSPSGRRKFLFRNRAPAAESGWKTCICSAKGRT